MRDSLETVQGTMKVVIIH